MANDSDLPHWIGDLPDPKRPAWSAVPLWQRIILLGALSLITLLAIILVVAVFGGLIRVFRWAAWGVGCG